MTTQEQDQLINKISISLMTPRQQNIIKHILTDIIDLYIELEEATSERKADKLKQRISEMEETHDALMQIYITQ